MTPSGWEELLQYSTHSFLPFVVDECSRRDVQWTTANQPTISNADSRIQCSLRLYSILSCHENTNSHCRFYPWISLCEVLVRPGIELLIWIWPVGPGGHPQLAAYDMWPLRTGVWHRWCRKCNYLLFYLIMSCIYHTGFTGCFQIKCSTILSNDNHMKSHHLTMWSRSSKCGLWFIRPHSNWYLLHSWGIHCYSPQRNSQARCIQKHLLKTVSQIIWHLLCYKVFSRVLGEQHLGGGNEFNNNTFEGQELKL